VSRFSSRAASVRMDFFRSAKRPKASGSVVPSPAGQPRILSGFGGPRRALKTAALASAELSRRIACHRDARRNIAGDDAPGTDHCAIADGDTGQDDRASADPNVTRDLDPPSELEPAFSLSRITGMIGRIDLHCRADLRCIADDHVDDIENDAVVVKE